MEQHAIATAVLRSLCGLNAAVRALLLLLVAMSPAAGGRDAASAAAGGDAAFRRVHLRCGADHMTVAVEATPGFEGVVYTRGSFHERRPPCFLSARHAKAARNGRLTLRFPLDACHTKRDADTYSNVVVVQADEELVMPGDAAFALQCDFSRPRDVTVGADLSASHRTTAVASRISMVEADPAAEALGRRRRRNAPAAANASDQVELTADNAAAVSADDDDFDDFEDDAPVAVPSKDEL